MKSIIVGTAGHIDHGKTALVKALTGIDADRLQEEKRRGITIDLGFAHMELPGPDGELIQIAFVDVPGHERFVRNMLAGVGGIDLVLLVIAADESIKPQTREHFDILQLLGVQRGITVLTKADAVDPDTLEVVRLEVEEFLRGTFLETPKAPIVAVSSLTGSGIEELKKTLGTIAGQVPSRNARGIARLPIDRVFTMKGFGTVVTGTLVSGTIRQEDELEVFPSRRKVRVRGVQVHGKTADVAVAGQRTALNLVGASTADLARGMMLGPPDTLAATRIIDVKLNLLSSAAHALKNRARVHFHCHSAESIAEVELYGAKKLEPSSSAFARLSLARPLLLLSEDHFILRQFSPVVTIGGGVILDSAPVLGPKEIRKLEKQAGTNLVDVTLALLSDFERRGAILASRVTRRGGRGLSISEAIAETGWHRDEVTQYALELADQGLILRIRDRLFADFELKLAQESLLDAVSDFHKRDPLRPGMPKGELQEDMSRALNMAGELFEVAISNLVKDKKIEVAGELVRIPGQGAAMKDEEAESKKKIEAAFSTAGLKVPALPEVLAGLKIDRARAQKVVTLLLREKLLVKVSEDLVFHRSALEDLRKQIVGQKTKSSNMDVALFKEMTGVSRKYAIPLLEYLDRERVTKRVGDSRVIL